MKKFIALSGLFIALVCLGPAAEAKGDDFGAVVRVIEQFYHVKHKSLPFLARAGIKTAVTAARIAGGSRKRLVEAGSVKIAFFEDQEFDSRGESAKFRASVKATLAGTWLPFIQVLSPKDEDQTYIFLRDAGEKYTVLVVTIERHDATVVQVNLARDTLAMLMQNPAEMGKAITDDATIDDQE
jgi:hypothetical protein